MTAELYHLIVWLFIAALISYTARTFLPDPFNRLAYFISGIIAVLAVFGFIAYLLGVTTPFAL